MRKHKPSVSHRLRLPAPLILRGEMEAVRPELGAPPRLLSTRLLFPLLLLLSPGSSASSSTTWDLVLLHTNDVHGRVEETSKRSGTCGKSGECFAGVARRATVIKRIRGSESNVLLLDAGDQFQGTVWFNYYKGAEAAHFMNKLQYSIMIQCPVVSANIRVDDTLAATFGTSFQPYRILMVDGQKVGVVGYTSRETPALSKPGPHLQFEDEVTSLQPHVDKLKTLGVDKIIALGHSGFTMDKEIAKKVRGVDVVIGGHSNTFLYTGTPPSSEVPAGLYPFMVTSDDGRKVPVVQAYAFGKYLGYLKVTFDKDGHVVSSTGNPILLNSSIPQDPEFLADVEEWKKNLANYSSQVIGQTLVLLNGDTTSVATGNVANNIRSSDGVQWNHVSASIFNGGGIRASIDELSRNGSITMEDLISVLPFGGTFDLVQLKGSTLRKAFEHSVKRYGESTGEFLQVSGLHVEFDLSKPPGSRVKSLSILCIDCRIPLYEPVKDEEVYRIVVPSYLVTGGDGFSMIKNETLKHNSGDLDITVVSNYITQRQKVYPAVEGRIKIYNSAPGLSGLTMSLVLLGLLWTLCATL
ncbi:hypothetical protein INR49_018407 [Caranx melampygus]|nr:hypothetical protein INR49_018407 [Caranx melampygus]